MMAKFQAILHYGLDLNLSLSLSVIRCWQSWHFRLLLIWIMRAAHALLCPTDQTLGISTVSIRPRSLFVHHHLLGVILGHHAE